MTNNNKKTCVKAVAIVLGILILFFGGFTGGWFARKNTAERKEKAATESEGGFVIGQSGYDSHGISLTIEKLPPEIFASTPAPDPDAGSDIPEDTPSETPSDTGTEIDTGIALTSAAAPISGSDIDDEYPSYYLLRAHIDYDLEGATEDQQQYGTFYETLDWSVEFSNKNSSWAFRRNPENYVDLQLVDPVIYTTNCMATCLAPFGEKIKIVVRSVNYPDKYATVTTDYQQKREGKLTLSIGDIDCVLGGTTKVNLGTAASAACGGIPQFTANDVYTIPYSAKASTAARTTAAAAASPELTFTISKQESTFCTYNSMNSVVGTGTIRSDYGFGAFYNGDPDDERLKQPDEGKTSDLLNMMQTQIKVPTSEQIKSQGLYFTFENLYNWGYNGYVGTTETSMFNGRLTVGKFSYKVGMLTLEDFAKWLTNALSKYDESSTMQTHIFPIFRLTVQYTDADGQPVTNWTDFEIVGTLE